MLQSLLQPAASEWLRGLRSVHCGHPDCGRWITRRALDARHEGVRIGEDWFCSWVCATPRLAELLSALVAAPVEQQMEPRMTLGMVLVQQGRLTWDQLLEAEQLGSELGGAVVRLGFCEERHVLAARAAQWGCPVFLSKSPPLQLRVSLPLALLRQYGMAPVHFTASTANLLVGFVHRVDYNVLYAIERVTGCRTQPCFIPPAELASRLGLQATLEHRTQQAASCAGTTRAMATRIASAGAEDGAHSAVLTRTSSFLWARLLGGTQQDLLFPLA